MEQQQQQQSVARQIIERVLAEHFGGSGVDALAMLAALVEALVERHVDVELRRLGRREPYPIHNERADALKAAHDCLHQQAHTLARHPRPRGRGAAAKAAAARKEALQAVMAVLMHCQFAAEKAAGIGEDDDDGDDDRGAGMRLVRE
jgi:hypothetical protein